MKIIDYLRIFTRFRTPPPVAQQVREAIGGEEAYPRKMYAVSMLEL